MLVSAAEDDELSERALLKLDPQPVTEWETGGALKRRALIDLRWWRGDTVRSGVSCHQSPRVSPLTPLCNSIRHDVPVPRWLAPDQ